MRAYRSARELQQTVDVLLAAQIALLGLRVLGWIVVTIGGASELSHTIVRGVALSSPFLVLLFAATAVALLAWVYRAAANLPALGAGERLAPWLAVALLVVPVANLAAAPWVLHTLWVASDPTPPPARRSQALVRGWAAALGLSLAAGLMVGDPRWDGLRTVAAWSLAQAALALAAAAACLAILRAVQRRQDEQWLDLERRRAVPEPAADRLR